ncbi:hypothetical protein CCHR01_13952 [Colletotrichum chrysophilum]|uniref:Uncharacterized protein n=1 Tax=Colletotrichum chrysophilum TaxID=1836956 RepID=A0AAD9A8F8_9PEZI|nr:hypothetical protein CCHR01_13952 [Colletotrichum chrysophilum]
MPNIDIAALTWAWPRTMRLTSSELVSHVYRQLRASVTRRTPQCNLWERETSPPARLGENFHSWHSSFLTASSEDALAWPRGMLGFPCRLIGQQSRYSSFPVDVICMHSDQRERRDGPLASVEFRSPSRENFGGGPFISGRDFAAQTCITPIRPEA